MGRKKERKFSDEMKKIVSVMIDMGYDDPKNDDLSSDGYETKYVFYKSCDLLKISQTEMSEHLGLGTSNSHYYLSRYCNTSDMLHTAKDVVDRVKSSFKVSKGAKSA